jgi:hypothetical protein
VGLPAWQAPEVYILRAKPYACNAVNHANSAIRGAYEIHLRIVAASAQCCRLSTAMDGPVVTMVAAAVSLPAWQPAEA